MEARLLLPPTRLPYLCGRSMRPDYQTPRQALGLPNDFERAQARARGKFQHLGMPGTPELPPIRSNWYGPAGCPGQLQTTYIRLVPEPVASPRWEPVGIICRRCGQLWPRIGEAV